MGDPKRQKSEVSSEVPPLLRFLKERDTFLKRFVLAEILGPPRGRVVERPPAPPLAEGSMPQPT